MNFVLGVPRAHHLQAATAALCVGSASPRKVADLLNVFVASAVGRGRLQHKGLAAHGQYLRVCISHSGSLCLSQFRLQTKPCEAVRKGQRRVFRRMLADLESQRPDGRRTPGPPGPASFVADSAPASGGAARRWQRPRLGPPHRLGGTWHRLARFFGMGSHPLQWVFSTHELYVAARCIEDMRSGLRSSAPPTPGDIIRLSQPPPPPPTPTTLLQIFGLTEDLWQSGPSRTPSFHVKWEWQEIGMRATVP